MVGATNVFLIIAAHRVVIEKRYLVIDEVLTVHIAVLKRPLTAISIDTEARTAVDRIIGNMNHLVLSPRPRVVKGPHHFAGIRVEIQHDFPRHQPVALAPVGIFNGTALADVHPHQTEQFAIPLSRYPGITIAAPLKHLW